MKTLTKHISCECNCKFDGRKFNLNQKWNNDKCRCRVKNQKELHLRKKNYIWDSATCGYEIGIYLASIIDDSVITCDEIIEETRTILTYFNNKQVTYKTKNVYISLAFLLSTIALLIAVGMCCYLIKYQTKQNIYCHITSQITN